MRDDEQTDKEIAYLMERIVFLHGEILKLQHPGRYD